MRICLYTVTALPKLGGQEAVVDALARGLLAAGHAPVVLAPRPRRPLQVADRELPYPVERFPRFFSTRHGVGLYRRWLLKAHRKWQFDVVHCHDVYPSGYLAGVAKPVMQVPIVMTSHGGDVREGNVRLAKPGMRQRFTRAVAAADALISIGAFTREALGKLGANAGKIVDIPNGVDVGRFASPVQRRAELDPGIAAGKYLLFMGRLAKRKGIDVLIAAMGMVRRSVDVSLVIAGEGDEESSIRETIAREGLEDRVRLVGRVSGESKTWLLQNAIATVMPSRGWEAFPLVVLESFAAGRPVIGTLIPGLSDVVADGRTGLLIPSEDPAALAAAINRVLQKGLADQLGAEARILAHNYDWKEITRRHVELYERVIAEDG